MRTTLGQGMFYASQHAGELIAFGGKSDASRPEFFGHCEKFPPDIDGIMVLPDLASVAVIVAR
jgi:hypothetical protein